tara:strand:+ start:3345 stop:4190 length:846 start_codon:yes stop_codon:yes gene_type:complete
MNTFIKGLYIVSTPIGNLNDITLRAVEVLKNSDLILCEDTRHSSKLLKHLKLKKKTSSFHKYNEKKELNKVIRTLKEGKILSLISDAGTPSLSDPGMLLVNECVKNDIKIFPIPGPSAITSAMSVSGFNQEFLFFGFLPKTENDLINTLEKLKNLDFSLIFFLPGKKINFYLNAFKKKFGDRKILIAREMTKINETFYRDEIKDIPLFKNMLKGELTVIISKKSFKINTLEENIENIKKEAKSYLKKYSLKDVVELIAKKENIKKNKIYKLCLELRKNENN